MFSAVMDICIYHINISSNHPFSHLFSLIKMLLCQTLFQDLFLLLVTGLFHYSLSISHHSLCVYLTLPPVSQHSFCCHSTLVIRLSTLIMVLLIIVHQIIIQAFHSDEVRGVIQRGPVKPAVGSVGVTCLNCRSELLPSESALPLGCESITLRCYTD